jgi:4-hydroxybenzoate polyprenyltransferase
MPDSATPLQHASAKDYIRLARPTQWGKGAFVLIGPIYSLALLESWLSVLGAFLAFGLASSGCYVINDIADRHADALHPRKKRRPIASGLIPVGSARIYAVLLLTLAAGACFLVPDATRRWWVMGLTAIYAINVFAYSGFMKQVVILDVISLSVGFVIRVMAGCAAAGVVPSTWLLNSTFFLAMFLALGKRLGERRTMAESGINASQIRGVHKVYTDDLLRMAVVMTAVGTLVTYAGYVEKQQDIFGPAVGTVASGASPWGFNLLWLTILPATFGLLRCIVLLEQGKYDDPTELAVRDRGVQAAGFLFIVLTAGLLVVEKLSAIGAHS